MFRANKILFFNLSIFNKYNGIPRQSELRSNNYSNHTCKMINRDNVLKLISFVSNDLDIGESFICITEHSYTSVKHIYVLCNQESIVFYSVTSVDGAQQLKQISLCTAVAIFVADTGWIFIADDILKSICLIVTYEICSRGQADKKSALV